ncbi:glutamate--cysteine ligase [Candidatus Pantoea carbekii]|uniref:Glutamate--cysteine ligase n=1 Tax=Candidatus Pantoea carbekii TaxID=1235990 RepID=U3U5P3_9GAMM|nr:glutamate--cysteine ligase [Candidatus Pantoea carbekii]AKC32430.1 glutamate-cysteine ligase GshA [Candidatus Pantoea carbekii]BAO00155.1 GshA protein [Candidatus Pantoea carbekii]
MIPDVSKALCWLEAHPDVLKNICRGIERETLRVKPDGYLATTKHPMLFGSPLKHKWITTDFAETLLEFITPANKKIDYMLAFLRDIHRYVSKNLDCELMWPFSMPCIINDINNIELAQYGDSNIGKMKTLYRKGLKNRYGALMQMISGVHYNFSLPLSFWQEREGIQDVKSGKRIISSGYLRLIRNYYRFGWIISYLFGASPAIFSSFLQDNAKIELPFQRNNENTLFLPYATSLRLSDLGYTNNSQNILGITFNSLESYLNILKKALKMPLERYVAMHTKDKNGNWLQLNTNFLQIENELYTPIRPKCIVYSDETPSEALLRSGIEYVEIRSLDVNPFSAIGIDADQTYFLDLFLVWCVLADAQEMSTEELLYICENWNRVIIEGRKPGQVILIGSNKKTEYTLKHIGKALLADLYRIAKVFDKNQLNKKYCQVCSKLTLLFDNPNLTYSARLLDAIEKNGLMKTGLYLAEKYHNQLCKEPLELLREDDFKRQAYHSIKAQKKIEKNDLIDFESYLKNLQN